MIDADDMLDQLAKEEEGWQREFKERFDALCERAEKILPGFRKPGLTFDMYGQAAGQARYGENRIRLSPIYCQARKEDMLRQTLPHEIAHILAFQKYRETGHGHSWSAMFGALTWDAPTRCHSYEPVAQAKRKIYAREEE